MHALSGHSEKLILDVYVSEIIFLKFQAFIERSNHVIVRWSDKIKIHHGKKSQILGF